MSSILDSKPSNDVIVGTPFLENLDTGTSTIKPGMLVVKGSTADLCTIGTNGHLALGWALWKETGDTANIKPLQKVGSAYVKTTRIAVATGGEIYVKAFVDGTGAVAIGDFLIPRTATAGSLRKLLAGTATQKAFPVVARAVEDGTASSTQIMVKSML